MYLVCQDSLSLMAVVSQDRFHCIGMVTGNRVGGVNMCHCHIATGNIQMSCNKVRGL